MKLFILATNGKSEVRHFYTLHPWNIYFIGTSLQKKISFRCACFFFWETTFKNTSRIYFSWQVTKSKSGFFSNSLVNRTLEWGCRNSTWKRIILHSDKNQIRPINSPYCREHNVMETQFRHKGSFTWKWKCSL